MSMLAAIMAVTSVSTSASTEPKPFQPADTGPAPLSIKGEKARAEGRELYYLVDVDGEAELAITDTPFGPRKQSRAREDRLRRAEPVLAPYQYFLSSDPAIKSRLADPQQPGTYARLTLEIDPSGNISACGPEKATQGSWDSALIAQQCPLIIQRMHFITALDVDGKPASDSYTLWINFAHRGPISNAVPRAIGKTIYAPAVAMPPPSLSSPYAWPVQSWMLRYGDKPTFRKPVFAGIVQSPIIAGEPVVGVAILRDPDKGAICSPMENADDIKTRWAACDYVIEQLKPTWPTASSSYATPYALLVAGSGKTLRAIGKAADWPSPYPTVSADAAKQSLQLVTAQMQSGGQLDRLKLWLTLDADGHVTDCKIGASSGSDISDIAACRVMLAEGRFAPGLDAFGRKLPKSDMGWTAEFVRKLIPPG